MKFHKYWFFFLGIALFQTSVQGQRLHRPVWQELDGCWKENGLHTARYIDWSWPSNDTLRFRQFRLNGTDTILLLSGKCNPFDEEVILQVLDQSNQQNYQFALLKEFNHALVWQNKNPKSNLQTLEWQMIEGKAIMIENGMISNYKSISVQERPFLTIGLQGGFFFRGARTNTPNLYGSSHFEPTSGYDATVSIGILGGQSPIGISIEMSPYQYRLNFKSETNIPDNIYMYNGQFTQSGIRLAFVPQVFFGKKQWIGIQLGSYFDLKRRSVFRGIATNNGVAVSSFNAIEENSYASSSRGIFTGISLNAPWKYKVKPFILGRYYLKDAFSISLGAKTQF